MRLADIVALQEVTPRSVTVWTEALRAGGLPHVRATVAESSAVRRGPHAYGVLVASRFRLVDATPISAAGWDEKVVSVLLRTPVGAMAMHNVHVPNGSANDWAKVDVLEAVFTGLSGRNWNQHTVLCGDFNTPQCELPSGQIITWAQYEDEEGRFRLSRRISGKSGLRWDAAERNILSGLQLFGMRDVFRSLHGYQVAACSWAVPQAPRTPRRFDHIFASDRLKTTGCEYVTVWREDGLSDHAAIEAVFEGERRGSRSMLR